METLKTVIGILLIVMGIFLIISVLMQSSKNHRMSGTIAGGAETFFGKQKGKTLDALFNKLTTIVTIVFVVLVLVLYVLQPSVDDLIAERNAELAEQMNEVAGDETSEEDATVNEGSDNAEETPVDENANTEELPVDENANAEVADNAGEAENEAEAGQVA